MLHVSRAAAAVLCVFEPCISHSALPSILARRFSGWLVADELLVPSPARFFTTGRPLIQAAHLAEPGTR